MSFRHLFVASVCATSALHAQRGGLQTEFIRRGDTTIARVAGTVPATAIKRLVQTMRIEPTDADTGLYNEVWEFDVDQQGRIWAFDDKLKTIFLFDAKGRLSRKIGRSGSGPGEFQHNGGMAVLRDGRLAVLDNRNSRISLFSPAGDFLTTWPVPPTYMIGMNSLIVDTTDALRLNWRGRREDNVQNQLLMRLTTGGGGFSTDTIVYPISPIHSQAIMVGSGREAIGMGLPYSPIFRSEWQWNGGFASANGQTAVITIAQPGGKVVRVERSGTRVRLTAEERREAEQGIEFTARRVDPSWSWGAVSIPTVKPHFTGLLAARDGRVWVRVAGNARLIPEDERTEQRPGGPPPRKWTETTVWEVFAQDGTFLGRVPFAKGGTLMHAFGNDVWVIERTADGFTAIVRYRIEPGLNS